MRLPLFRVAVVFCSSLVLPGAIPSYSQMKGEPQLVRVTYAQGEVKFSPGINGKPELQDDWMQAATGLTIEQGYTLATENGRAIVEFENGSMVYLAEHSVLQFLKLQIKQDVTTTKLNLLTGTLTIAHVSRGQDGISIATPANTIQSQKDMTLRMDSLLNGTIVRALDTPVAIKQTKAELNPGETLAYLNGLPVRLQGKQARTEDDWDKWVAGQRLDREATIKMGLAESGLSEPIPGLVDLVQNGHFFDCPPYGRCWEPNEQTSETQATEGRQAEEQQPPSGNHAKQVRPKQQRTIPINFTLLTRCPMEAWRYSVPLMDLPRSLDETYIIETLFPWSGCFTGRWYFRGRHPVYVIGHRHHHHHQPFWTVHTAHGLGVVPRSPLDRKGQPPANAKYGTFVLAQEKNGVLGRFDPTPVSTKEHWKTGVPKSFAQDRNLTASVPKVPTPLIQGRMVSVVNSFADMAKAIQGASQPENAIHYDYQTRNFVAPRGSVIGGNASRSSGGSVVVAHVGSHGVSGGGTAHGGGGSHGGGRTSGGSSGGTGGGGHSAGGGSSGAGGGGGHAGASSSASGGGGGSHH